VTLLLTIVAIGAIFTFVADSVASQTTQLSNQFVSGLNEIERSLAGAPFHIRAANLTQAGQQIRAWVTQNGGSLAGQALGGASVAAEVLTGLALAVFCSVFFLNSGSRIWDWLLTQVGGNNHRWDGAARAGWATFAGYTRGIVIIAGTNAALVCVALLILRVPLALPLALLTFFATFIPLIGAPIALFVATLVALAARGPPHRVAGTGPHRAHRPNRRPPAPTAGDEPRSQHPPARSRPLSRLRNSHRRRHRCRRGRTSGRGDLDGLDHAQDPRRMGQPTCRDETTSRSGPQSKPIARRPKG